VYVIVLVSGGCEVHRLGRGGDWDGIADLMHLIPCMLARML